MLLTINILNSIEWKLREGNVCDESVATHKGSVQVGGIKLTNFITLGILYHPWSNMQLMFAMKRSWMRVAFCREITSDWEWNKKAILESLGCDISNSQYIGCLRLAECIGDRNSEGLYRN